MDGQLLRLTGVSRNYGTKTAPVAALQHINLTVNRGEFVAVAGAPGSGKSSLISMAAGLDQPTHGEVFFDGIALRELDLNETARLRRRSMGLVLPESNLVPTLTALENVALPLELDGIPTLVAQQQAEAALDAIGIADVGGQYRHQLSASQQRRVAVARAIVGERKLVLADEPTSTLGFPDDDGILTDLRKLADQGIAVLLVTGETRHTAWADRVVFIDRGRILGESLNRNSQAAKSPVAQL